MIDCNKLRKDLEDYLTGAIFMVSRAAIADLTNIQSSSETELIKIAKRFGFDLNKYIIK